MITCSNHCRACGAHFRSTAAFDLHRKGSHQNNTRHCVDVATIKRASIATRDGVCTLNRHGKRQTGQVIWRDA